MHRTEINGTNPPKNRTQECDERWPDVAYKNGKQICSLFLNT